MLQRDAAIGVAVILSVVAPTGTMVARTRLIATLPTITAQPARTTRSLTAAALA
jgi:hypothetical protein